MSYENHSLHIINCNRDILFKKYNKRTGKLVRLDYNKDLLFEKKRYFCKMHKRSTIILYVDMSSSNFMVCDKDFVKCGNYDYNKEILYYYEKKMK